MTEPGFNLLATLAKTAAKVNAMETVDRFDENKKFKQENKSDVTDHDSHYGVSIHA